MPILLPNGELCANRFSVPPQDKDVIVRFQDRYWYGVDTSGRELNTIYYSEVDEPESVPSINQIVLQQSGRDADVITALAPVNSTLMIFQERHVSALSFASNPVLDAQVQPVAFRGCMNQRCWDIYDGVVYVLDQIGVYSIGLSGEIEEISAPIANLFDQLDLLNGRHNFIVFDQNTLTLRVFVAYQGDNSDGYPTRSFCYALRTSSWYMEKYPQKIRGATNARIALTTSAFAPCDIRSTYAGESGLVLLNEGSIDLGRGAILAVSLTNRGSGYKKPPSVSAAGGVGAEFQSHINDRGEVTAITIRNPGRGYSSGSLTIAAPDDTSISSPVQAVASYSASSTSSDTSLFIPYRLKTGCSAFVDDVDNPAAAGAASRQVRLEYRPQEVSAPVSMRLYYNNSKSPRPNLAARTRGAGFSFSAIDSSARLDLGANTIKGGADDGVASAQLSGRTIDDLTNADRNVSIEVSGARTGPDPVIIYGIDVSGTVG